MEKFQILASPWWVNLLLLVPVICFLVWRKAGHETSWLKLFYSAIFAISFGINEAVVVVYLREVLNFSGNLQVASPNALPNSMLLVEIIREAATMVMLLAVSLLSSENKKERWVQFIWMFAFWDIFYYVGLFLIIGWPSSLLTPDVLFLIPEPWVSQVWFPVTISLLSICAVILTRKSENVIK